MAEGFGVATAAIGLASAVFELTNSIKKLKTYCREVKDAPQAIQDLIDEVETMTDFISQANAVQPDNPLLQKCIAQCKSANDRIAKVADDLKADLVRRRRRTSVIFPFSKREIDPLLVRLERGKSLLASACQLSTMIMMQNLVITQQQQPRKISTPTEIARNGLKPVLRKPQSIFQGQQRRHRRLQNCQTADDALVGPQDSQSQELLNDEKRITPSVLRHRPVKPQLAERLTFSLWQTCVNQASRGWQYYFRTYGLLPEDSPALAACRDGDVTELQRILCNREAGLHDRTGDGSTTLLEIACVHGHVPVIRFLRDMDAPVNFWDFIGYGQKESIFFIASALSEMFESRAEHYESEYCEIVKMLGTPWELWTPYDLQHLFRYGLSGGYTFLITRQMIRFLATRNDEFWAVFLDCDQHHEIAVNIAMTISGDSLTHLLHGTSRVAKYLVADELTHKAKMASSKEETLLQAFIQGLQCAKADGILLTEDGTRQFREWISALKRNGIDLQSYGDEEQRLWPFFDQSFIRRRDYEDQCFVYMYRFSHGPCVDDWKIFMEHPGDCYVGDFWDMIEHPERTSPGAWIDEQRLYWDDTYFKNLQVTRSHGTRQYNYEMRPTRERPDYIGP